MDIPVICPSCRRIAHVPRNLAGRKVRCPRCSHPWRVPEAEPEPPAEEDLAPEARAYSRPLTLAARLGIAALALGSLSIMVLCLPLIGYSSLILSGGGLVLGLWGLARSIDEDAGAVSSLFGCTARGSAARSRPVLTFPLMGVAVCLLALALALFPFIYSE